MASMTCPRCHTAELVEKNRTGVLIDICTSCRGVWLDRGELDKLIAVAANHGAGDDDVADDPRGRGRRHDDDDDDDRRRYDPRYGGKPSKKKRAKSIFEEIFDF